MKVLLEIPDNKATALMEVLRSISYVKAQPLTEEKAQLLSEIRQAVKELKLVRSGKLKAKPIEVLLDEL